MFFGRSAAAQNLSFERYTVNEGLSQNSVLAIGQDSKGFMLFGTRHFLNKFDTRSFKVYVGANQLESVRGSQANIKAILTDSRGEVWVGTEKGLNKYISRTDSFFTVEFNDGSDSENGKKESIRCLNEDRRGNIWIGTAQGISLLKDRKSLKFVSSFRYKGKMVDFKNWKINTIFETTDGALLIRCK